MGRKLEVKRLSKKVNGIPIAEGLSFSVNGGEIVGLLGESGSGKTTILKSIAGILRKDGGEVYISKNGEKERLKPEQTGFVFQSEHLYDELTAWENVECFTSLYGKFESGQAETLLEYVGLGESKHVRAGDLSSGQRKRLNLICSLTHEPEVLFFDEPTAGLDPVSKQLIWKIIKNLKELGLPILMATHRFAESELLCDKIAILEKGRFSMFGTPDRLLEEMKGIEVISFKTEKTDPSNLKDLYMNLDGLSPVVEVQVEGRSFTLYVTDEAPVTDVLKKFKEATGTGISALSRRNPSLEDVFKAKLGAR